MSFDFDGVDDRLALGSPALLDNLSSLTCALWVLADGYGEGNAGRIFDKFQKLFRIDNDDNVDQSFRFSVACSSGGPARTAFGQSINLNSYNFLAVTWGGGISSNSIRLYKNGIESSSYINETSGLGAILNDGSSTIDIGNNSGGSRSFDGRLAHFHIYSRVLDIGEIKQIMNFPGSIRKNLSVYLPMVFRSTNSAQDLSGNRLNATIIGPTQSNEDPPINGMFTIPRPELMHSF